jgi:CheY-like chemotaxis protein
MPKMNGLSLLRAVRSRPDCPYVPFIFLTSKSEVEDVALASDGGASGVSGQARDDQGLVRGPEHGSTWRF